MFTRTGNTFAQHRSEEAAFDLVGLVWRYRVELALLAGPVIAYVVAARSLGAVPAAVVVGLGATLVLVLILTVRGNRRRLADVLVRAHWRRRVERALERLAPSCFGGVVPRVRAVARSRYAVHVRLRLRPGHAPTHVEDAREHLATALRVREVRVERDASDLSHLSLTLVRVDTLAGPSIASPILGIAQTTLWEPIPIGIDEGGRTVPLALAQRSVLTGGEPGYGKSNLIQGIASWAALDPSVSLYCCDPKLVGLSRWAPVSRGFAGVDVEEALAILRAVKSEMDHRYAYLERYRRSDIGVHDGVGLIVVIVDELLMYFTGEKKAAAAFGSELLQVVTMGRAAGVVCVLAAQKPSADVLPSSIRTNLAYRVAFRTATREASDTILGAGRAANGYSAADLASPGVCWLLAEGPTPRKVRTYYLSDDDLDLLAERARVLRS